MDVHIVTIRPEHAEALEQLQRECFPTLGEDELMTAEHFLSHCRVFPEGDFVAVATHGVEGTELAEPRVVGLGSGFFTDFDFTDPRHTFQEIIAEGYYTNHDPEGAWYYGGDISVHPGYRGLGIGGMLYDARKDLVRRRRKRGIVAGGVLPGYAEHRGEIAIEEYVERVRAGELFDPTLSFQLKHGFEVHGLLEDYLEDSASDNWATLIVWRNPDVEGEP